MTSLKQDSANYDKFAPNFGVTYKIIQHVSVPNFKFSGSINPEVWAKGVGEFPIMLYAKMSWWTWLPQYKCTVIEIL